MKNIVKAICLLFIVFVVLNSTSVIHGQTTLSATVSSTQLKMRDAPSLKATIITYLARNEPVTVDGRNRARSWVHVILPSGMTGWAYRYYLKFPRKTNIFKLPILDGTSTNNGNSQSSQPVVVSFTAQSQYLDQSGKVTLNWSIQGGTFAGLEHRINGASEWHGYADLQPTGSLTIDLKPAITPQTGPMYFVDFWLHYGNDKNGQALFQYLRVECPPSLFFRSNTDPLICPLTSAQNVQAAFQPFEKGFMIWRGDNKWFYALSNDGYVIYAGGEVSGTNKPLNPAQIPTGRYQPVNGFGRLWDNTDWIRTSLGWATAPESAFTTSIRESVSTPSTPYDWAHRVILTAPNGRTISLSHSGSYGWSYVD